MIVSIDNRPTSMCKYVNSRAKVFRTDEDVMIHTWVVSADIESVTVSFTESTP